MPYSEIICIDFYNVAAKALCVLHGAPGFLHLLVPVCRQCVQTKYTKSKKHNW